MEIVKYSALAFCLISSGAEAQSPYLSVQASMDVRNSPGKKFRMEMKICEPVNMSHSEDWFSQDTSKINFATLKKAKVKCGHFQSNGEGIEVLSGDLTFAKHNSFSFSNQIFAWEKIIVFRITDVSSADSTHRPDMYVFLPIKYKSFVTFIKIEDITFVSGQVLDLSNALGSYSSGKLSIPIKADVKTGIPVETFPGKEWVL